MFYTTEILDIFAIGLKLAMEIYMFIVPNRLAEVPLLINLGVDWLTMIAYLLPTQNYYLVGLNTVEMIKSTTLAVKNLLIK